VKKRSKKKKLIWLRPRIKVDIEEEDSGRKKNEQAKQLKTILK
jgi:hypothetical protein